MKVYVAVDFEVHIFLACQLKVSVRGIILYPTLLIIDLQMYLQVTECSFFGINSLALELDIYSLAHHLCKM